MRMPGISWKATSNLSFICIAVTLWYETKKKKQKTEQTLFRNVSSCQKFDKLIQVIPLIFVTMWHQVFMRLAIGFSHFLKNFFSWPKFHVKPSKKIFIQSNHKNMNSFIRFCIPSQSNDAAMGKRNGSTLLKQFIQLNDDFLLFRIRFVFYYLFIFITISILARVFCPLPGHQISS